MEKLYTPSEEEKLYASCPFCGAGIPSDAEKCPTCSFDFDIDGVLEKLCTPSEEEEIEASCPFCSARIPSDAEKCPLCSFDFETDVVDEFTKKLQLPKPKKPKPVDKLKNLRRDKILFYIGMILIMIGGYWLAFGSWFHDIFRVPIIGDSYDVFGWINVYFAVAGFIVLFIGLAFLLLSLRGGVIPKEELKKLKAEG